MELIRKYHRLCISMYLILYIKVVAFYNFLFIFVSFNATVLKEFYDEMVAFVTIFSKRLLQFALYIIVGAI